MSNLPEAAAFAEGTVTLFNPDNFPRKLVLLFRAQLSEEELEAAQKAGDENPLGDLSRKVIEVKPGENQLDTDHYEALRRSCGEIEGDPAFDSYTKSIINDPRGVRVLTTKLTDLYIKVRSGEMKISEVFNKRDAIAIAKSIGFSTEEVQTELEEERTKLIELEKAKPEGSRAKVPEIADGKAKSVAYQRTQHLIAKLYDEATQYEVKQALQHRLSPQQLFDRGLVEEDTMHKLNDSSIAVGLAQVETDSFYEKVTNSDKDKAIALVKRTETDTDVKTKGKAFTGLSEMSGRRELIRIAKNDKRKEVRAAARERLLEVMSEEQLAEAIKNEGR